MRRFFLLGPAWHFDNRIDEVRKHRAQPRQLLVLRVDSALVFEDDGVQLIDRALQVGHDRFDLALAALWIAVGLRVGIRHTHRFMRGNDKRCACH
jgi:hypothetical protein